MTFEVPGGQMVALAGPSGSGKTTLLNCIGLLEEFDSGRLVFGATDATKPRGSLRRRLYRRTIGFLFQNSGLVDSWTVRDNLNVAFYRSGLSRAAKKARVESTLELMGLGGMQDDRVYTLSGGEQQRVGLARLLLKDLEVVLADEPTASLDGENSDMVIEALRQLAARGAAVIVSTHDERVVRASDAILRLDAVSREHGSRATLLGRPDGQQRHDQAGAVPTHV